MSTPKTTPERHVEATRELLWERLRATVDEVLGRLCDRLAATSPPNGGHLQRS